MHSYERIVTMFFLVPIGVWLVVLARQHLDVSLLDDPMVDIVMTSIPRDPSYLDATLESLTQVSGARIVLFNAATSYENHTRLLPWCDTFLCVSVPPTPSYDLERAVRLKTKTPNNGLDYLVWRTKQNHAVRYALTWIMTHRPSPHVIVIEDDVVVQSNITSFVPDTVSCLRQGTVYCGAVAYLFERQFVWTVLRQLYLDIHRQPIDFIFERAAGGRRNVARQSFVRHNGEISSSPERHRRYIRD